MQSASGSRSNSPAQFASTWATGPTSQPNPSTLSSRGSPHSPSLSASGAQLLNPDPAAATAPIPQRIFEPRLPYSTDPDHPTTELIDANPVAIPRLDTRKIAQLNRVSLPDSVRSISSSRTAPHDPNSTTFSILSQLNNSRPMTDRPTLSSEREKTTSTNMSLAGANATTPQFLQDDHVVNADFASSTKAFSPAMTKYFSLIDTRGQKNTYRKDTDQEDAVRSQLECYRPVMMENEDLRDVRIKNIYGVYGYKPDNSDDDSTSSTDEPADKKSKQDEHDMEADVFKVEGRIVRELVMAIDSKNMKWLKNEFKREKDEMLTGPQFIKSIGQLLTNPESLMDEDENDNGDNDSNFDCRPESSTSSQQQEEDILSPRKPTSPNKGRSNTRKTNRIVGYGYGTYKAKNTKELLDKANAMLGVKKVEEEKREARMRRMATKVPSTTHSPGPKSRKSFSLAASLLSNSPSPTQKSLLLGVSGSPPELGPKRGDPGYKERRQTVLPGGIVANSYDPNAKRASILPGGIDFSRMGSSVSPPTVVPPSGPGDPSASTVEMEMMLKNNERKLKQEAMNSQKASLIYKQVDLLENGMVSWNDFTNYIVKGFQYTEVDTLDQIRPYFPTTKINTSYKTPMSKIFQIEDIGEHGSLVLTETGSKSFKICTPKSFSELHEMKPSFWKEVKGHDGDVLSISHIPELGYLATSGTDCTMQFWDTQELKLCQKMPTNVPVLTQEWQPTSNNSGGVLFTAGLMNPRTNKVTITAYDPMKSFKCVMQLNKHTDTILDLYSIPTLHTLVSCGMDSNICLWDLHTGQFKKTLTGHTKGVLDIDYSHEHRLLVSAGFDHDVLVWNPHVEQVICPLSGHTNALIGVKMSERSPEILSASNDGIIKIWDIRTFKCVQTLKCEAQADLTDFTHFEGSTYGCIVVAEQKTLHMFENEPDKDPTITDMSLTVDLLFQSTTCSMITAAGHGVKVWDARNGLLQKSYDNIFKRQLVEGEPDGNAVQEKSEITACCLDWTESRLVLGTASGKVTMWLLNSMTKLYDMDHHKTEISNLSTVVSRQLILSTSWDGEVKVQMLEDKRGPQTIATLNHATSFKRLMEFKRSKNEFARSGSSMRGSVSSNFGGQRSSAVSVGRRGSVSAAARNGGRRGSIGFLAGPNPFNKQGSMGSVPGGTPLGGISGRMPSKFGQEHRQSSTVSTASKKSRKKRVKRRILATAKFKSKAMLMDETMYKDKAHWEVKHMAISNFLGQFATVTANPVVLLWDMFHPNNIRPLAYLSGHESEISGLTFLSPFPAIASCDCGGNIYLWTIYPSPKPHRRFYNFSNPSVTVKESSCAPNNLGWHCDCEMLLVGDAEGRLKLWDISNAMQSRGVTKLARARLGSQQFGLSDFSQNENESDSDSSSSWLGSSTSSSSNSSSPSSSSGSSSSDGEDDDDDDKKDEDNENEKNATTFNLTSVDITDEVTRERLKETLGRRRSDVKPEAVCVRHWEAHKETIEKARIISSNLVSVTQFGHKHHRHRKHHHHKDSEHHHHQQQHSHKSQHPNRRPWEIPDGVVEFDIDAEYKHNNSCVILSVSFDLTVKLWGLDGSLVGLLQQGAAINTAFGREECEKSWRIYIDDHKRAVKFGSDSVGVMLTNAGHRRASRLNSFMAARRNSEQDLGGKGSIYDD
ncbi:hypothetical protein TL16_g01610 [Triparma laevis f. inornata]|uniref:Uncharacterized protein n=1 Tax=Triparma laevis f. inornata TaxID=1714386 RepID=A0A9W6ZQG1_9STRA|nr:hypothetical protein TL16_g01610 [Triparma laevis f. inornata]